MRDTVDMAEHRRTCGTPFRYQVWVAGKVWAYANSVPSANVAARQEARYFRLTAVVEPCALCGSAAPWTVTPQTPQGGAS